MADNEMEAPAVQVLPNTTEPVDFSAAQQVVFDAALKKAMGRAGADARAEAERLRIENERLKAQAIGAAPDSSEVEKLRAQVADSQLQAADAERRAAAQSKAILQARLAETIDTIDGDSVTKLLKDNLQWNETSKSFDVLDDNGAVRNNPDGSKMTAESLYSEFAGLHPWAIRGRVLSGGGGTGSAGTPAPASYDVAKLFGPGSDARLINQISITNPPLYKKVRAEAKARNLVV